MRRILSFLLLCTIISCGGGSNSGSKDSNSSTLSSGSAPAVNTYAATSVSATGATLNGNVTPNGLTTNVWFEWGTNLPLGSYNTTSTQLVGSSAINQMVSSALTGLSTGVIYYFRIAASNSAGTSKGIIGNFIPKTDNPPQVDSLSMDSGQHFTTLTKISLQFSGSDDVGLRGYYLSEDSKTPSVSDTSWQYLPAETSYSTGTNFILSESTGTHTVYLWLKDTADNISTPANKSIVLVLWQKEDVTTVQGVATSIALDASDNPHIIYTESGNLKYTKKMGTSWNTIIIDSGVGGLRNLALDSQGYAHVVYKAAGGQIKYATNKSGSFINTVIDSNGSLPAIALDPNGVAHVTYDDAYDGYLKFASNHGGSWNIINIPMPTNAIIEENSVAVDSNGVSHVSYHLSYAFTDALMYATDRLGSWMTTTIDDNGYQGEANSIAVDQNLHVHISSYNNNNSTLSYATDSSGAWVVTKNLASMPIYATSSIATDVNGKAHISSMYYTGYQSGVMYFTNAYGDWIAPAVDPDGDYSSIAVDSKGMVHIVYNYAFSSGLNVGSGIRYARTK